eukprot:jgi/Mesvir1/21164/Mv08925-RA.1
MAATAVVLASAPARADAHAGNSHAARTQQTLRAAPCPVRAVLKASSSSNFLRGKDLQVKLSAPATCRQRIVTSCSAARPWVEHDARLVLEDGSVFPGVSFGVKGTRVAEVVFNTSLTGYQEILTDPSYAGQFVTMTNPHIGNTGTNSLDMEADKVYMGGLIIRRLSPIVSNYRSEKTLSQFLTEKNVMGIAEVDTRRLTRVLRETGALMGVISTDMSLSYDELVAKSKSWSIVGKDLISEVSSPKIYKWVDPTEKEWEFNKGAKPEKDLNIVVVDFGVKHNILRRLASLGCDLTVVPCTTSAEEIKKLNPDGIMFSNGPGDPSAAPACVANVKSLLGSVPVFGICMGHQMLGQAFGGKTFKLKFGHHGGNHPIRGPTGRIEISAQNHNFAVDPATLPPGVIVSHVNLNDGTCAGMVWPEKKAMSIQYHPEASPGPHDSDPAFDDFVKMVRAEKAAKKK